MRKLGQAALEYLLTYGWAILIVIIVGASLYALGIFNPATFAGHRSSGFLQLPVKDWLLDDNANLSITFGNNVGKTVTIGNVTALYKNKECSSDNLDGVTIGPSIVKNITLKCATAWQISGKLDAGSSYSIVGGIQYTNPDTMYTHTDQGQLFGVVEKS